MEHEHVLSGLVRKRAELAVRVGVGEPTIELGDWVATGYLTTDAAGVHERGESAGQLGDGYGLRVLLASGDDGRPDSVQIIECPDGF